MKPEKATKASVIQRLKEIDEERSRLVESARTELLEKVQGLLSDLADLGERYDLVKAGETKKPRASTQKRRPRICSICKFGTDPSHDLRAHNFQEKDKAAFTDEQLAKMGYDKLAD